MSFERERLDRLLGLLASERGDGRDLRRSVMQQLAARGVVLTGGGGAEGSGLHGVMVTPLGLSGGADPRREGVARKP
jgi:gamma-glutamyltranspeptidase